MSAINISIIVTEASKILESTLLRVDIPVATVEEAEAYRKELDEWLEMRPIPGQPKPAPVVTEQVAVDSATLIASQLPEIIDRFPVVPSAPLYFDIEGERASLERRPYDYAHVED